MPEDIQPDLCTHIIFAFGWLKKGKLSSFESNDETKDGKTGLYDRINNLKKANPKLKTLLAIGELCYYNPYVYLHLELACIRYT
jgi:chitinase